MNARHGPGNGKRRPAGDRAASQFDQRAGEISAHDTSLSAVRSAGGSGPFGYQLEVDGFMLGTIGDVAREILDGLYDAESGLRLIQTIARQGLVDTLNTLHGTGPVTR